jgi:RNA polymerase sigma-70 factor (ECF subfamily)
VNADERAVLEARIKELHQGGDLDGAITAAIGGYGGELFGFLVGLAGDSDRAGDVFGAACERIWKGLPKFRWESSFRVWAYSIARNEFLRAARTGGARERRQVPLSNVASVAAAIDRVRTETPAYQRTSVKDTFAKVRAELSPDDHMLLGLRLDRKMAWNDISEVLGVEAATLRKRFERLKDKLQTLVRGK